MKFSVALILVFFAYDVLAQDMTGFEKVDKLKIEKLTTTVYFKDPLKALLQQYPDFDNKDNKTKHELLADYLHHNILYIFQAVGKDGLQKSYVLRGNPKKLRSKNYLSLDVVGSNDSLIKTIDKVNVGGSFFEHMLIFQSPQGKEVVGKGIQMWGYFVLVEPYEKLRVAISSLIKMDVDNTLPDAILAKVEKQVEPLFAYQSCGLQTVKSRNLTITVYQYDSLGQVKNQYPRTEKDSDLYYSSISEDLTGVTTFPFFSSLDSKEITGDVISVNSTLLNINHYLKDIKVTMRPNSVDVERIEGKLIIHGYSATGHSTSDELYLAEFGKIGGCWLPKTIKFVPLNDLNRQRPRLVTEINYELR